MTSRSNEHQSLYDLQGDDLKNYGYARVRDLAYDAVQDLWKRRKSEGWTQIRLAENLSCDTGWLSKHLKGPGNWTFRTFGALVEALHGSVEIKIRANEDIRINGNFGPYSEYCRQIVQPHVTSAGAATAELFSRTTLKISTTPRHGE